MWLDADDVVPAESITAILKLKETLSKSPQPDVVMMKYIAGFQPDGTPAFTYDRERILRTDRHFRWKGRATRQNSLFSYSDRTPEACFRSHPF